LKPAKSAALGSFSVPPVAGSVCGGSGSFSPQNTQRSRPPTSQYFPACWHWSLLPHAGEAVLTATPTTTIHCSATIATPASRPQLRWTASASAGSAAAK
jgi:hypothetical protein